jgi:hypothetical protein
MATQKQEAWLKANEPEAAVWEFYDYPDHHDQQSLIEQLTENPETHVYRIHEEPTTLVISDTPLTDDRIAQAVEASQRHTAGWYLVNGDCLIEVWERLCLDPETLEDIAKQLDIPVPDNFRDQVAAAQDRNAARNEAAETADLDALKVEMTTAEAQQKAAAATFYAVKEKYEFAKCIQSLPKDK